MDKLYTYLENISFPQGRLKAAINNALKLRKRVYQIFEDGRVPLTNNPVEQAIRPSTLIRKNSLFAVKSSAGSSGKRHFLYFGGNCRPVDLNIYKYFKYLFDYLPNRKDAGLEAYLPSAQRNSSRMP